MVLVRGLVAVSLTPATLYTSWRVPLSTISPSLSLTQLGALAANPSSYQLVTHIAHTMVTCILVPFVKFNVNTTYSNVLHTLQVLIVARESLTAHVQSQTTLQLSLVE